MIVDIKREDGGDGEMFWESWEASLEAGVFEVVT
jgi:hypothetical protein